MTLISEIAKASVTRDQRPTTYTYSLGATITQ